MGISQYLKEIARGKEGARALTRVQAADLFGQLLDGTASDLEIGAFCIAMRVKGETPQEMAGFLDATHARLARLPASGKPLIVLPSYNGARRLPVLTPLLALLLARQGWPVLVHGAVTETLQTHRIHASNVLQALGVPVLSATKKIANGEVAYAPAALLHGGLQRLLEVRRVLGLRNPAHSLVKLMNPSAGPSVVVGCYTHPEYARSMAAAFELTGATAMLLRGTEGEPVADARRLPRLQGFVRGCPVLLAESEQGPLAASAADPGLPRAIDAESTARYIQAVLAGQAAVPAPIVRQAEQLAYLAAQP